MDPSTQTVTRAALIPIPIQECEELCPGWAYFGTQHGEECFCGDESSDFDKHGEASNCNVNCAGDPAEVCGGSYANSIYRNHEISVVGEKYRIDIRRNRFFISGEFTLGEDKESLH